MSALFLTVGIVTVSGGMQTVNACHGCHQDDVVRKGCSERTASPRSCFDALDLETIYQACYQTKYYQTKEKKKRTVNFFVLGETDINTTNGTFKNLTRPGQGLIFTYSEKGSSASTTIIFTTDQTPTYNTLSKDSKYPIWRAVADLPNGAYTGIVRYDDFEKNPASLSDPILTQDFTVDRTHTAVMMAPYLYK